MATNLILPDNDLAVHKACLIRVARLGSDCTPLTGTNMGVVSSAIMSVTSDPEVTDGTVTEPVNGCGLPMFSVRDADQVKRWTFSGDIGMLSWEAAELIFGGELLLGVTGGDYAGKVVGWATPHYQSPPKNGLYFEVFSKVADSTAGDCVGGAEGAPPYVGRVFPKVRFTLGAVNQQNDHVPWPFTGIAELNPNIGTGPWDDSPVEGGWTESPVQFAYYSQDQYDDIEALAAPGYVDV